MSKRDEQILRQQSKLMRTPSKRQMGAALKHGTPLSRAENEDPRTNASAREHVSQHVHNQEPICCDPTSWAKSKAMPCSVHRQVLAIIVSENVVWVRELKHPTPNICTFCPDAAANAQRLLRREKKLSSCSSGIEKICNSAASGNRREKRGCGKQPRKLIVLLDD